MRYSHSQARNLVPPRVATSQVPKNMLTALSAKKQLFSTHTERKKSIRASSAEEKKCMQEATFARYKYLQRMLDTLIQTRGAVLPIGVSRNQEMAVAGTKVYVHNRVCNSQIIEQTSLAQIASGQLPSALSTPRETKPRGAERMQKKKLLRDEWKRFRITTPAKTWKVNAITLARDKMLASRVSSKKKKVLVSAGEGKDSCGTEDLCIHNSKWDKNNPLITPSHPDWKYDINAKGQRSTTGNPQQNLINCVDRTPKKGSSSKNSAIESINPSMKQNVLPFQENLDKAKFPNSTPVSKPKQISRVVLKLPRMIQIYNEPDP